MKKLLITLIVLITSLLFSSFQHVPPNAEITITVTSDHHASFDMLRNGETLSGLKTPYVFTLSPGDDKFIFKSSKKRANLEVTVENGESVMTGTWPIVVLLVEQNKLTTFGMN